MSDFKSSEYTSLIGGTVFEPREENPMLGFRGASRYAHLAYAEGFALECRAMKRVRVPNSFAVTATAYRRVLDRADPWDGLHGALDGRNVNTKLSDSSAYSRPSNINLRTRSWRRQCVLFTLAGQNDIAAIYPNFSIYFYWSRTGKVLAR